MITTISPSMEAIINALTCLCGRSEFSVPNDERMRPKCDYCGHEVSDAQIRQYREALTRHETSHDAQGCSPVLNQPKGR